MIPASVDASFLIMTLSVTVLAADASIGITRELTATIALIPAAVSTLLNFFLQFPMIFSNLS